MLRDDDSAIHASPALSELPMSRSILARISRHSRIALLSLAALGASAGVARAAATVFSGRVWSHSTNQHFIYVGWSDLHVVVRGDGDTDLDCWLYGPDGELVSSDTDDTDVCVLRSPGIGVHRVVIRNYGGVYNDYIFGTTSR
jgi:hypothetical protein